MIVQNVVVLADVGGALHVQLSRLLHVFLSTYNDSPHAHDTETHVVVVVHHLRLYEFRDEIGVDLGTRLLDGGALLGVPRSRLVGAHRVERVQAEKLTARCDNAVERALLDAVLLQILLLGDVVVEQDALLLQSDGHDDVVLRLQVLHHLLRVVVALRRLFVRRVQDVHHGDRAQQLQALEERELVLRPLNLAGALVLVDAVDATIDDAKRRFERRVGSAARLCQQLCVILDSETHLLTLLLKLGQIC